MPTLRLPDGAYVDREPAGEETSDERFDRAAFARRALDLIGTPGTTVAICEGARRLRVESGPLWGRRPPRERWAMLAISPTASRRAIALAVAEIARAPRPYAFELLLRGEHDS
jgi:hypothetical protein